MRTRITFLGFLAIAAIASAPAAQSVPAFEWRLPIHRNAQGELWAAGPTYKVRFDDGVTYVPVLGSDAAEAVYWRWRTAEVRIGDAVHVDSRTPHRSRSTDWHHEIAYDGGVAEVYDVRPDGVEQRFVIDRAPATAGDLVVAGRVSGLRTAETTARGFAHRDVAFVDVHGADMVGYGAAIALDARGRRIDIDTRIDGDRVELRLARDWLADATFPVVVDPLITTKRYPGGEPSVVDVVSRDASQSLLMTATRASSRNDWDLVAVELDASMNAVSNVMTDLTTLWSTRYAQCAAANVRVNATRPDRWLVVAQRDRARSGASEVWVYAQDVGTATNSGTWLQLPGTAGASQRFPSISGADWTSSGLRSATIVFQEDIGIPAQNTSTSSIWSVKFDWDGEYWWHPFELAPGGQYDNEWPSIVRGGSSDIDDVVVWQRRANPSGRWTVMVGALDYDQPCSGCPNPTVTTTGLVTLGSSHSLRPVIDGYDGRFLVAFTQRESMPSIPTPDGTGYAISVQRVDVADRGTRAITLGVRRRLVDATGLQRVTTGGGARGIGHDRLTASHWAIGYTIDDQGISGRRSAHLARVGFSGGITESVVLQQSATIDAFGPSVAFHDATRSFPVVWASTQQGPSGLTYARGSRLEYPNATVTPFGTGCAGTLTAANNDPNFDLPYAGSEFFRLELTGGVPSASTFLMAGFGNALNLQLSSGCVFRVGPGAIVAAVGTSNANGDYGVPMPLPDVPLVIGNLYWQVLQVTPRLSLTVSNGLATDIR